MSFLEGEEYLGKGLCEWIINVIKKGYLNLRRAENLCAAVTELQEIPWHLKIMGKNTILDNF